MNVRLVPLIVQLLVKERIQLLLKFVLSAQGYHAVKEHGSSPTVLPARSLIKSVSAHFGVVCVNVHEFPRPDGIEKFLATLFPFLAVGLFSQVL